MTETEIVKALECHKERELATCNSCPYLNIYWCDCQLSKDALALINRKNAEIDRLTEIEEAHREQNGELRKEVESKNAEIEKLCGEIDELIIAKDQLFDEAEALIKKARAEAIKEVLGKVEALFPTDKNLTTISRFALRQIAKEMGVE